MIAYHMSKQCIAAFSIFILCGSMSVNMENKLSHTIEIHQSRALNPRAMRADKGLVATQNPKQELSWGQSLDNFCFDKNVAKFYPSHCLASIIFVPLGVYGYLWNNIFLEYLSIGVLLGLCYPHMDLVNFAGLCGCYLVSLAGKRMENFCITQSANVMIPYFFRFYKKTGFSPFAKKTAHRE